LHSVQWLYTLQTVEGNTYKDIYHSCDELADAAVINAAALRMAFRFGGAGEAPTSSTYFADALYYE